MTFRTADQNQAPPPCVCVCACFTCSSLVVTSTTKTCVEVLKFHKRRICNGAHGLLVPSDLSGFAASWRLEGPITSEPDPLVHPPPPRGWMVLGSKPSFLKQTADQKWDLGSERPLERGHLKETFCFSWTPPTLSKTI